jgi:hypothetical protein
MHGTDTACYYLIIGLVLSDFVELIVKVVKMLLTNKYNWEEVYVKSNQVMPTEIDEGFFNNEERRKSLGLIQ